MTFLPIKNVSDRDTILAARTTAIKTMKRFDPNFDKRPNHKEIALALVKDIARAFEINVIA